MTLFREVADIKTADQLDLPTPDVEYHNIVAQPTEIQKAYVRELSERATLVHNGSVPPNEDNMLKITTDGRKLGLDQRLIDPKLPDEANTKVNKCVENVLRIWREGAEQKLTQLVFCDISTPQAAPSARAKKGMSSLDNPMLHTLEQAIPLPEKPAAFSVYNDIRDKLIAQGVPPEQIAFIHTADTEVKKKELFAKVRNGQVRVLLGSTAKMGAGTNVQDLLYASHDLDCPWRPGDLEQRKGRTVRQGNSNDTVHIFRYVTEGTFDAYLWQTVETKQRFISQIMTSKTPVRSCQDVDEAALSYAEIKALCAGDPRIKERMDLDVDVARLKLMKADYQSNIFRLQDDILTRFPAAIKKGQRLAEGYAADLQTADAHPHPKDGFAGMEIEGTTYDTRAEAGKALLLAEAGKASEEVQPIGQYRGFALGISYSPKDKAFILHLDGALKHEVDLGEDEVGNITRIENVIGDFSYYAEDYKKRVENLQAQLAAAEVEVKKPFEQEEELKAKTARLAQLDAELNLGTSSPAQVPDDLIDCKRPSVLQMLKAPCVAGTPNKNKTYEEVL